MMRVVIYTDQPMLAIGLERVIAADPAFDPAGCFSSVATLKEHLAHERPDLAVLDLTPQIASPVLRELQALAPACKLILWCTSIAADFALQALTAGVRGVLRKTLSPEAHGQCLRRVGAGELWFEKSLTDSFRTAKRVALTPRESQLVALLSRGLKNKEISAELGLTEGTVKVYLAHLFDKAGAKDRFDMALHALKNFRLAGISPGGPARLHSIVVEGASMPGFFAGNPAPLEFRPAAE